MSQESIQLVDADKQSEYYAHVRTQYPELPRHEELTLFEPVYFTPEQIHLHEKIQEGLQRALTALIARYSSSAELQALIPLEPVTRDYLLSLQDSPFTTQLLRPDLVYDETGKPYVCEVNARFVFNGLYVTKNLTHAFAGSGEIPAGTQRLIQLLDEEFSGKQTAVVKGREPDYDLFYYRQNNHVLPVEPEPSMIDSLDNGLDVVLEVHQDELDACIGAVTDLVHRSASVTNDPRTIFIAHDKRLLAALSDAHFMGQYIPPQDAHFLAEHIVPTWVEGWRNTAMVNKALGSPSEYVIKGAISGKSQAYYDLRFMQEDDVSNIRHMVDEIVVQKRIKQTPTTYERGELECAGTTPMTLQGDTLGMGVMRWYEFGMPHILRGISLVLGESA